MMADPQLLFRAGRRFAAYHAKVKAAELRYADCPTTEAEVVIDAAPAIVWALVCDIQTPAEFSSEFQGGQWLGGVTGPALGATFRGRNHHDARGTETGVDDLRVRAEWVFGCGRRSRGLKGTVAVHPCAGTCQPVRKTVEWQV
jgi:hypothetical protein